MGAPIPLPRIVPIPPRIRMLNLPQSALITPKNTTKVYPPIPSHLSQTEVLNKPPNQPRKSIGDVLGPNTIKPQMAIDPEPSNKPKSKSKTTYTEKPAQETESETKEWYHHVNPIESNEEFQQRTRTDDKDLIEDEIMSTKEDSANLLRAKPSRLNASISAARCIWHPHIVTIDSVVGPNLINIELLKPEWRDHIQQYQHPRYTGTTGHSIRFHGVTPLYLELDYIRAQIWFGVVSNLPPKLLLGNAFNYSQVKSIDPKADLVRLIGSRAGPILATRDDTVAPISISQSPDTARCIDSSLAENPTISE